MVESISKTGSPGWVRAGAMPASRASEVDGVFVAENFSYMYECLMAEYVRAAPRMGKGSTVVGGS